MALRRQALDYGDEASQYGFESYKQYKKGTRGGLKGAISGGTRGAQIGAGAGTILGTAVPGVGNLVGLAAGTSLGAAYGAGTGFLSGNRKMKKEYLKYAKDMTEKALEEQRLNSPEEIARRADMAAREQARLEDLARQRALYGTTTTQPIVGGELPMFKEGGVAKMVMINVEKGELAIDPRTMKVIMDFNNVPKHPKGKDVINQKGNVKVPVGTIIIPADKRKEFLAAKPAQRIEIAGEIIESQREKEEGEEMEMEEQMPMQGQGMMAMMGGEEEGGEEGGEEMKQEKMMNGGYVKKYVDGGDVYYDSTGQPYSYNAYGESVAIRPGTESTYDPSKNVRELSPTPVTPKSTTKTTGGSTADITGGLATGIGLVGAGATQIFGGKQQKEEATKALQELNKQPWEKYAPTGELEQQGRDVTAARKRAEYGFSPEELAARQQMQQQASRTAYHGGIVTGKQIGRAHV